MACYPPQIGSPERTSNTNFASPRRDTGNDGISYQLPARPPWPMNLPGFLDPLEVDLSGQYMFDSSAPPVDPADVPVQSTETSDETPEFVNDDGDSDSHSELSEITYCSYVSENEEEEVIDQDTEDDVSVIWVRAFPPRPAQHAFRFDDDDYPARSAVQTHEDDGYDFHTHFSLAPRAVAPLLASDVIRAGPRTAAGRAQLRVHGIVDDRRGHYMEARQRLARRQNDRALAALNEEMEDEEETDDEGAATLTVATMRARYLPGSH